MKVAIFSDLHGKVLLPFKLVDLYQKETGNKIDFILQCGDVGIFPDSERMDKPTLKHALRDKDELGFHDDFVSADQQVKEFLDKLDINMICVRGNHEDHDYLDRLEDAHFPDPIFPVDVYKRIWICRSGVMQELVKNNERLSFVGIGRAGDRKGRKEKKFIQDYEREEIVKLLKTDDIVDVLITHDRDDSGTQGYGMAEIRQVLDNVIFRYHFYGHTGEPYGQKLDYNGITQSIKIKELEFDEKGCLPEGCMMIIDKNQDEMVVKIMEARITNKLTKYNWKFTL